jgi:hypothetical protein
MRRAAAALVAAGLFLCAATATAHRIDEYLQATILSLETNQVRASMRLIPGTLVASSIIAAIDSNGDGVLSADEQHAYAQRVIGDLSVTIDGKPIQPKLVTWIFPPLSQMREGEGEIQIEYTLDLPSGGPHRALILENHHLSAESAYLVNVLVPEEPDLHIQTQKRDQRQSLYELDYDQTPAANAYAASAWDSLRAKLDDVPFSALFHLGQQHIAEGTDHLLFLLALLLPAPLLVSGSRWAPAAGARRSLLRILGIVTAFTIGHSITLGLAAQNVITVPQQPIEALIALSILVSAAHALRPIFPGKEAWIAAFFGLVHGLAFATVLQQLQLQRWGRVAGVLSFNLGIEAMQVLVVALILPSLLLMSRTRAYAIVRVIGALFAGLAAMGWLLERLTHIQTPVDAVVNAVARHGLALAVIGFGVSLVVASARWLPKLTHDQSRPRTASSDALSHYR